VLDHRDPAVIGTLVDVDLVLIDIGVVDLGELASLVAGPVKVAVPKNDDCPGGRMPSRTSRRYSCTSTEAAPVLTTSCLTSTA
jgi:hypothetical protein